MMKSSGTLADLVVSRMAAVAVSKPRCIESKIMRIMRASTMCSAFAATYATAIARGHVFNDANKRTGLTCALTYLEQQGITIPRLADLEEIMVEVVDGQVTSEELAEYLSAVWELSQSTRFTID
ncbi:type II toxin-antitoxin system death-on-curing family toxin [Burkholderia ubonensis]|uniref:type II toxin-antitoxin system death-on-curing family toxin n=1 Tax=Burkholderia ubonensis TaxID=101571 RepID=UPI000B04C391|nr:type II toxin-antitoxin system death-on-curing family toxin [Burkholderia ubonensis]MDY7787470.1 type II toxin-antitoxin system death-on-curing family toxin [Burkholderia ubonensis]